jgi:methionyl-tRNA formyltransferase
MRLDEGLDTGPVYACTETAILPRETAASLRPRLSVLGAGLLVNRLAGGVSSLGTAVPQVGEATYAAKLSRSDLRIEWMRPAVEIERLVRVGRAWTTIRHRRLIVWEAATTAGPTTAGPTAAGDAASGPTSPVAPGILVDGLVATGDGWLELGVVQVAGRQRQTAAEWLRGARIAPGEGFS